MLKLLKKITDKAYIKQWNVGLTRMDFDELQRNGHLTEPLSWLPLNDPLRFYADPFIYTDKEGFIHVFYEDFHYGEQYGKISVAKLDKDFQPLSKQFLLDTGSHLSYPNIIQEQDKIYLMPENSKDGEVQYFQYDTTNLRLHNPETIFRKLPLLDSTILFHNNKYWLFATHRGPDSNNQLHIYHAPHWTGPYTPHKGNPVKNNLVGTRPAGQFIRHDGKIYRPTQNCGQYYGKSIIINEIQTLTEDTFVEEAIFEVKPPENTKYNFAIHTINFSGDVIVIDGLRRIFAPLTQIRIFIKKAFASAGTTKLVLQTFLMDESIIPYLSVI